MFNQKQSFKLKEYKTKSKQIQFPTKLIQCLLHLELHIVFILSINVVSFLQILQSTI